MPEVDYQSDMFIPEFHYDKYGPLWRFLGATAVVLFVCSLDTPIWDPAKPPVYDINQPSKQSLREILDNDNPFVLPNLSPESQYSPLFTEHPFGINPSSYQWQTR